MTAEAPSVTAPLDPAGPPAGADPLRDDPVITDLVTRARTGDQQAWDALVERYATLTWSICRRYRLGDADAEDVGQTVWLQLADHLDAIREPAALPGWLATTTRRECLRVLGAARGQLAAEQGLGAEIRSGEQAETVEQQLLAAERHAALREAFTALPPRWQRLMVLLTQDPPVPYAEISARLGIPVGSVGPYRSRCLARLRRHPAIAGLARPS
jgi:RNA polymerase sigma factor (sigma-70 family)